MRVYSIVQLTDFLKRWQSVVRETENWLTVLKDAELITAETFQLLYKKVVKIKILLIKSIKTLKSK